MKPLHETRFYHVFEKTGAIAMQGHDRNQRATYWNTASEIQGLELKAEVNVLLAELGRLSRYPSAKSDRLLSHG